MSTISTILGITPERARLVEGFLRLQYSTIGQLSATDIRREYVLGGIRDAIDEDPITSEKLAASYGL